MEHIHVLEPAFHISSAPIQLSGKSRIGTPRAKQSVGAFAGKLALHVLERLKIYRAPRIINAECFFTDNSTTAGDCR